MAATQPESRVMFVIRNKRRLRVFLSIDDAGVRAYDPETQADVELSKNELIEAKSRMSKW